MRSVYGTLPTIERDDARRLWRERLEVVWAQVLRDVEDRLPGATTAAVRIADRAARLDGLDEPARLSLTPSDGDLHRWVAAALEVAGIQPQVEEFDIFEEAEIIED